MPIRTVPQSDLNYFLVCVDRKGAERTDDPDGINGRLVPRVTDALAREPFTDVFLMTHGWMGDVKAAIAQYDPWIGTMVACQTDVARAREVRPGFKALLIGFHWPSLPYGDEQLVSGAGVSFSAPAFDAGAGASTDIAALVDAYADRIADTPAARQALQTIFSAAADNVAPQNLSPEVVQAYHVLDREAGLSSDGPAAGPGGDREPFDPEAAYQGAREDSEFSYAAFGLGPVVKVLQLLSFFKMKDRARMIGETSVHTLLANLQRVARDSGRDVRFHLMGHSFGCIVMSGALAGPPGKAVAEPVHSAFLAQGAVSFWTFCSDVPHTKKSPGYFRGVVDGQRVRGALVTTQSEHDTAVGKLYPAASGARGDVVYAVPGEFPKYGALGTFGARGPGVSAVDLKMLDATQAYGFERGKIYNIDSSQYVAKNEGFGVGAHNDIAHPQVAHAMWSAVLL